MGVTHITTYNIDGLELHVRFLAFEARKPMAFYVFSILGATRLCMRVSFQSRDREMEVATTLRRSEVVPLCGERSIRSNTKETPDPHRVSTEMHRIPPMNR